MKDFNNVLGFDFNNKQILNTALTHSSYSNEKNQKFKCNERLEFLGDSILSLIISEHLYTNFPDLAEGDMSRTRANIVCERSLAGAAHKMELGKYLLLGKGEAQTGGRERNSILADAIEAIIAAIYLDLGFDKAKEWVLTILHDTIEEAVKGKTFRDYKTALQEKLQSQSTEKIEYEVTKEEGPDHNKTFWVSVSIGGKKIGSGSGKTKKEADQNAAENALEKIHE